MKKRTIGLLLAMSLSCMLYGCGNSAEPQQEEQQVQEEQEAPAEAEQEESAEPQEAETPEVETPVAAPMEEDYYDPEEAYQKVIAVLDELIDAEKIYTPEEFTELLPQIFEKAEGAAFNPELVADATESGYIVHMQGALMKEDLRIVFYNLYLGLGGVPEIGMKVVENATRPLKENEVPVAFTHTTYEY